MKYQKTAIAAAVAQIAVLYSSAAWAQTTGTETVDSAKTAGGPQTAVVVVSGQRAALESAQKIKQNSDEVVDSVVAEDIGKLPDRSVTEVLSRVVGVTMDRSAPNDPQHLAVEGSGITIRGLSYVASQLNGRQELSAGGGHNLGFSEVPPELMAGVDVYKNPSAENIEGGISGMVNLRTAMPFDFKGFKGSISADETYSTLRKGKPAPSGSVLLSNRWNTGFGEFGALIDLANSTTKTRNDEMFVDPYYPHINAGPNGSTLWIPKGVEWRSQAYDRKRKGDYAAFQWRPIKDITTSLTYFRSRYTEDWSEQALLGQDTNWYDSQASADSVFSPTGAFLSGTLTNPLHKGINYNTDHRVSNRQTTTQDISLNVQWRVNSALTVTNDFQRVKSKTQGLDSDVATGILMPSQTVDFTGSQPKFTFSPSDVAYLSDPKNYYWAYTMEHADKQYADSKAWKTDVKYAFDNPVLRDIRFGVRLQNLSGINNNTNPSYNWQGVTQPWMVGWEIPQVASLDNPQYAAGSQLLAFPNFFGGKQTVPAVVFPTDATARDYPGSYSTLHSYFTALCNEQAAAQSWGSENCKVWTPAPMLDNRQSQQTRAAYTQLRFGWDDLKYPIDGNIGVRYVRTTSDAAGYTTFTPNLPTFPAGANVIGSELIPNIAAFKSAESFHNKYNNWLPSLNLRLKASEQLQFRFAVAKSMSSPDFNQLQAYTQLREGVRTSQTGGANTGQPTVVTVNGVNLTGDGGTGNPNLRPTTGLSEDLTAEWYFAKAGSLTFAVFNKSLKDIIVNQLYKYTVNDASGNAQNFTVTGPVNGAHGYARGFEIAYQQYYDFVPDWLRGIGTQASFTLVNSKRQLNNPVYSAWCTGGNGADNLNLAINGCDTNMQSFGDMPLQGLSKKTVNFAIMYEHGPIQTRLAYNWRSRFLLGVNTYGVNGTDAIDLNPGSPNYLHTTTNNDQAYGLPLYQEAYGQLDGSFFYQVTPKFRIGVEATNLGNTMTKQTMVQHAGNLGHAWYFTGRSYSVKASYDF